jgi:hypothetical protein
MQMSSMKQIHRAVVAALRRKGQQDKQTTAKQFYIDALVMNTISISTHIEACHFDSSVYRFFIL